MTHEDEQPTSLRVYSLDEAAPSAPSLQDSLAAIVPLRGWRLRRLSDAIGLSINREIRDGGANPHDESVRSIVTKKHLRGLEDALKCSGPFAENPQPAALLAIRLFDRSAFEAYGKLQARMIEICPPEIAEAKKLREMLLAVRLRMICFDWATIALLFEGLGHPCDTAALRKRQSRVAELASTDASARESWWLIDGYLKARKRSFGGTARRIPLWPVVVLLLALLAAGATAAIVAWRHTTPARESLPPPGDNAQSGDIAPTSPGAKTSERPAVTPGPQKGASTPDSLSGEAANDDESADLAGSDWGSPIPIQASAGVTASYRESLDHRRRRFEARATIGASKTVVRAALRDVRYYGQFVPDMVSEELPRDLPQQPPMHLKVRYRWPIGLVNEAVSFDAEGDIFHLRIEDPPHETDVRVHADVAMWRLLSQGDKTVVRYTRTIDLSSPENVPATAVFDLVTSDLSGMFERLREHAYSSLDYFSWPSVDNARMDEKKRRAQSGQTPRLALLVTIHSLGSGNPIKWWAQGEDSDDHRVVENALIQNWAPLGVFTFVDHQDFARELRRLGDHIPSARAIAQLTDADVIVTGTGGCSVVGGVNHIVVGQEITCDAWLTFDAFDAASGSRLTTMTGQGSAQSTDPGVCDRDALLSAVSNVADRLRLDVKGSWPQKVPGSRQ